MMKHPAQMTPQQRQEYRALFAGPNREIREVEGGEIYIATDRTAAMAFAGKAIKPAWNYSFRSVEHMQKHIDEWAAGLKSHAAYVAERKAEAAAPHSLKVGDVLHSSWGYDQTNNDYFQVTALVGKRMVEIRQIANDYRETGFLCGKSKPVPGKFIGEPMRKLVNHNRVRIESFATAGKIDANHETYESHYA